MSGQNLLMAIEAIVLVSVKIGLNLQQQNQLIWLKIT